jgi:hypothetical protein
MRFNHRQSFVVLLVVVTMALISIGAGFNVSAKQGQPQTKCPTTKVTCPAEVSKSDKLTFTAEVKGGDQKVTPTYNWTVSAGSIESGQGTTVIEVSTKEVPADSTVTATVDVGGFDRECGYGSTASSCTTVVIKKQ